MSRGKEVKKLREKMGMNRREFSDYYGIPYRTIQDWEAEKREIPDYLLRLLKYRAEIERRIKSVILKMCPLYIFFATSITQCVIICKCFGG